MKRSFWLICLAIDLEIRRVFSGRGTALQVCWVYRIGFGPLPHERQWRSENLCGDQTPITIQNPKAAGDLKIIAHLALVNRGERTGLFTNGNLFP